MIVMSEYNQGYTASLKNALDYLNKEWNGKPVAFVGYGWGGCKLSVEQLDQVVEHLQMKPFESHLYIYFRPNMFDKQGKLIDT